MPTYDINGFKYKSPNTLTEAELMDLANNLHASGALDPEARNQEITGRADLKANTGVLDAYRTYYRRINGKEFAGNPDELVDDYMQQMRDWNLNTGSLMALSGRLAGNSFNEKERQAIAVMWDAWDRTVPFYKQKDGKWQGLVDSVQSIATDPTNLIGLFSMGTGTAAAVGARETAKLGVRQAIKQFAVQGAKTGAIQGGIDGAVTNTLEQNVKTNIGRQEGFSMAEVAGATAFGAAGGVVLGGTLGAGQGYLKGAKSVVVKDNPLVNTADNALNTTDGAVIKAGSGVADTAPTRADMGKTFNAAEEFNKTYSDEAFIKEARTKAREDFLNGVSDTTRRAWEKNGDLGKTVSFEDAKARSGELLDRIGVTNYADDTEVATKLVDSFNSGKLNVTDLSTLTATTIGVENHLFEKFRNAYLNNSADTVKLFESYEKVAGLNSHLSNQQARSTAYQARRMRDTLDPITYAQAVELAAKSTTGLEAKSLQDLIDSSLRRGVNVTVGTLNEFWVYNILGSVKTLTTNLFGGLQMAVFEPGNRALGGLLSGDKNMTRSALREYVEMSSTVHQSALYALKSFYNSKAYLDGGRLMNEAAEKGNDIFVGSSDLPIHQMLQPWKHGWANTLGNLNRFIGKRGMLATDELIKQMTFRGRVMGLALDDALAKGYDYKDAVKLAKIDAQIALQDQLDAAVAGRMSENPLARKALEYSRYSTFQNDLSDGAMGKFGKSLSDVRNNHPIVTQVMPFIRTPFNIMNFVSERTPVVQTFTKTLQDKIARGGRDAAEAEAAIHVGSLIMGSAIILSFTDMMEGSGPLQPGSTIKVDKNRSAINRGAGIQPYSVLIDAETGERVQINKLDPYGRFFTLMGKVKDIYKYGTKADQDAVMTGLAASFATNFAEMSSLTGVKEVIDLFQNERTAQSTLGKRLGSFVPYFRLMNDVYGDDFKVAYSIVDEIAKNIPGINKDMDRMRHPLFGTVIERSDTALFPMSPLPIQKQSYDDVDRELVRLNTGIEPPESKLFNGRIDLTKIKHPNGRSAYDRMQELVGLVKHPATGKNLYEQLRETVQDPRYVAILSDPTNELGVYEPGGKAEQIRKVVRVYRDLATKHLITNEMPELTTPFNKAYAEKRASNSNPRKEIVQQKFRDALSLPQEPQQ